MLKEKEIDQELEEEELPNKEKKPSWLEKLKNRLPKLSSSISAKLLACFVFAGYLFFFSSRLILPGGILAEYTPIGTELEFPGQNKTVTVSRWEYSPEQHLMEVELLFDNRSFDGINTYVFDAMVKNFSVEQQDVQVIISTPDLYVVHIPVPEQFRAVSLRMLPDVPGITASSIVKIYTNPGDVTTVASIAPKTEIEYRRGLILSNIDELQEQIVQLQDSNAQLKKTIANVELKNEQLENEKRYSTEKEILDLNADINSNCAYIEQLNDQIEDNNEEIAELRQRIENIRKQAADLS